MSNDFAGRWTKPPNSFFLSQIIYFILIFNSFLNISSSMGIAQTLYNVCFKRTSSMVVTIGVGAFAYERCKFILFFLNFPQWQLWDQIICQTKHRLKSKISAKNKLWNWLVILMPCNSLTSFECKEAFAITRLTNFAALLTKRHP